MKCEKCNQKLVLVDYDDKTGKKPIPIYRCGNPKCENNTKNIRR